MNETTITGFYPSGNGQTLEAKLIDSFNNMIGTVTMSLQLSNTKQELLSTNLPVLPIRNILRYEYDGIEHINISIYLNTNNNPESDTSGLVKKIINKIVEFLFSRTTYLRNTNSEFKTLSVKIFPSFQMKVYKRQIGTKDDYNDLMNQLRSLVTQGILKRQKDGSFVYEYNDPGNTSKKQPQNLFYDNELLKRISNASNNGYPINRLRRMSRLDIIYELDRFDKFLQCVYIKGDDKECSLIIKDYLKSSKIIYSLKMGYLIARWWFLYDQNPSADLKKFFIGIISNSTEEFYESYKELKFLIKTFLYYFNKFNDNIDDIYYLLNEILIGYVYGNITIDKMDYNNMINLLNQIPEGDVIFYDAIYDLYKVLNNNEENIKFLTKDFIKFLTRKANYYIYKVCNVIKIKEFTVVFGILLKSDEYIVYFLPNEENEEDVNFNIGLYYLLQGVKGTKEIKLLYSSKNANTFMKDDIYNYFSFNSKEIAKYNQGIIDGLNKCG